MVLNVIENNDKFFLNNFKNNTIDVEHWGNATWDNGAEGNYFAKKS